MPIDVPFWICNTRRVDYDCGMLTHFAEYNWTELLHAKGRRPVLINSFEYQWGQLMKLESSHVYNSGDFASQFLRRANAAVDSTWLFVHFVHIMKSWCLESCCTAKWIRSIRCSTAAGPSCPNPWIGFPLWVIVAQPNDSCAERDDRKPWMNDKV